MTCGRISFGGQQDRRASGNLPRRRSVLNEVRHERRRSGSCSVAGSAGARPFLRIFRQPTARPIRLQEWPGERLPKIYYDPRSLAIDATQKASLHAKCIVIDNDVAFVSSANFTEAAQERNIEIGVSIQSRRIASELSRHFASLVANGLLKLLPGIGM